MTRFLLLIASVALSEPAAPVVGGLVKSDEWIVRRGESKEEEFRGNVRYKAGPTDIAADWALYRHATQSWKARGRVKALHALEDGSRLAAEGGEAAFGRESESGSLAGPDGVKLKRFPQEDGEPDRATAERLSWEGRERAVLQGRVLLNGPRLETASDKAVYTAREQRLDLSGSRPVLLKHEGWAGPGDDWNGAFQADGITGFKTSRRITAEGSVKGWAVMRREK